jgi:hypothetical protein
VVPPDGGVAPCWSKGTDGAGFGAGEVVTGAGFAAGRFGGGVGEVGATGFGGAGVDLG